MHTHEHTYSSMHTSTHKKACYTCTQHTHTCPTLFPTCKEDTWACRVVSPSVLASCRCRAGVFWVQGAWSTLRQVWVKGVGSRVMASCRCACGGSGGQPEGWLGWGGIGGQWARGVRRHTAGQLKAASLAAWQGAAGIQVLADLTPNVHARE